MTHPSSRTSLLNAGQKVMFSSGYNGSSVRDIVAAAGVAQGSFTNHFRSKEVFASEVLAQYFEYVQTLVDEALADTKLSPRARLIRYFDIVADKLAQDDWSRGCLIGDLSLETASQSETLRTQLKAIFAAWREPFAACIAEAQKTSEIAIDLDPTELADFLLASWQGAMMRMKVERDPAALERFKTIISEIILRSESKEKS